MKSTLDTHLRVVDVVLICKWRHVFLGHIFSSSGHIPGLSLKEVGLWVEK
jgi:hypothetical protein